MRYWRFLLILLPLALISESKPVKREKRQSQGSLPPIYNGEILTSAFQIPIQTLNAVHSLLQATRGRFNALQDRYQAELQRHPNHRPNPHFVSSDTRGSSNGQRRYDLQGYLDRRYYNSKALFQR